MSDVTVFKATQDVDDGVGFADVGKKLVAESLTFGGSFYQAGNINEFKLGRYDVFRVDDSCQFLQSFIGYGNTAGIRFNGAKRKVCRLSSNCLSQSVKKSWFSDIGEADDAAVESHFITPKDGCLFNKEGYTKEVQLLQ